MGPSIRGIWSPIHVRLRPPAIGINPESKGFARQQALLHKRKLFLKAAVFRGDPREFLG